MSEGDTIISTAPLPAGTSSLAFRVRGTVKKIDGTNFQLAKFQVYLPGIGWFPAISKTNRVVGHGGRRHDEVGFKGVRFSATPSHLELLLLGLGG